MKKFAVGFLVMILILSSSSWSLAHPGNTASDGCHYCRTNCDRWGVPWNERHCHGGSSSPRYSTQNDYSSSTPDTDSSPWWDNIFWLIGGGVLARSAFKGSKKKTGSYGEVKTVGEMPVESVPFSDNIGENPSEEELPLESVTKTYDPKD